MTVTKNKIVVSGLVFALLLAGGWFVRRVLEVQRLEGQFQEAVDANGWIMDTGETIAFLEYERGRGLLQQASRLFKEIEWDGQSRLCHVVRRKWYYQKECQCADCVVLIHCDAGDGKEVQSVLSPGPPGAIVDDIRLVERGLWIEYAVGENGTEGSGEEAVSESYFLPWSRSYLPLHPGILGWKRCFEPSEPGAGVERAGREL